MRDSTLLRRPAAILLGFGITTVIGCASTQFVRLAYSPTGVELPVLASPGLNVRFELLDERPDPLLLGITNDIYSERIELTQEPKALASEGFQQLLSDAGFLFTPDAPLLYQVRIERLACEGAHAFGAQAAASASFRVRILDRDDVLGGKLITGFATVDQGAAEGPALSCSRAFSHAFSQAMEKAVADAQIIALVRQAGS